MFGALSTAASQVSFGASFDMATFTGEIGAGSIYGGGGGDSFDFNAAVGAATIDLGAGADSLNFSGAVAGATISGTDTAGDVAILTGTNTAVFSAVGTGAQGELRWQRRHVHLRWSRWCGLDLRRHRSRHF